MYSALVLEECNLLSFKEIVRRILAVNSKLLENSPYIISDSLRIRKVLVYSWFCPSSHCLFFLIISDRMNKV